MPSSRGSSSLRDQTPISYIPYIGRRVLPLAPTGKPFTYSVCNYEHELWCQIHSLSLNLDAVTYKLCCCCLVTKLCPTLWDPMDCSTPRFPFLHRLLEFTQIHVPWVQWCYLTISSSAAPLLPLPSIFPSIRMFSSESALHIRWPKYWSFSFSISPSNEYSGLVSFRIDWFDLLTVKGTLKSSPAPKFEGISSLALSLLYGPTLRSTHNY